MRCDTHCPQPTVLVASGDCTSSSIPGPIALLGVLVGAAVEVARVVLKVAVWWLSGRPLPFIRRRRRYARRVHVAGRWAVTAVVVLAGLYGPLLVGSITAGVLAGTGGLAVHTRRRSRARQAIGTVRAEAVAGAAIPASVTQR